ncbi:MAG: hypothetical protein J6N53_09395 [Lachnospiraceae bacterium]|nr:hypothetical protein [Lachnospiraceae bacterium]MBP3295086.1 hypothetical protein [Lachnospiraceae bacterium]
MERVVLGKLQKLDLASSSKGEQEKYYDPVNHKYIKLPFYYEGRYWKDYMVEHLSGRIFGRDYTLGVPIVDQEIVMTDKNLHAVRSDDFCKDGELWISFARIYDRFRVYVEDCRSGEERLWQMINTMRDECGVDIMPYLCVMFTADFLLLNEDRHFNNLGLFYKKDGSYGIAPLFDFGLGLFEHQKIYEGKTLEEIDPFHFRLKPLGVCGTDALAYLADMGCREDIAYVVSGIRMDLEEALFPSRNAYNYYMQAAELLRRQYERKV